MHWTSITRVFKMALLGSLAALSLSFDRPSTAQEMHSHTSKLFTGPKANKGTVTHTKMGDKNVLTLSVDFVVPDTPDPHWQVVDSHGTVYQLEKLKVKGDRYNKSITLPGYIHDVKKVVIWCAFAETNLGEAEFEAPVM